MTARREIRSDSQGIRSSPEGAILGESSVLMLGAKTPTLPSAPQCNVYKQQHN